MSEDSTTRKRKPLSGFVQFLQRLPMPLKALLWLGTVFYSLPLFLNLWSAWRAAKTNRLKVFGYSDYMFVYPLISSGFVFCALVGIGFPGEPLGWMMTILLLFTLVTMGFDFKMGVWAIIVALGLALVAMLGWLGAQYRWPVFHWVGDQLARVGMDFPVHFWFPTCVGMSAIYIVMLAMRSLRKVLMIEGNFVIVKTFMGKGTRNRNGSYSLDTETPDVNEMVLGFSNTLVLQPKSRQVERHEFTNVPGGPVVASVLTSMLAAEAVEDEDDEYDGSEGEETAGDNGAEDTGGLG